MKLLERKRAHLMIKCVGVIKSCGKVIREPYIKCNCVNVTFFLQSISGSFTATAMLLKTYVHHHAH